MRIDIALLRLFNRQMWKSRKIRIVVISLLLIALVGFVFYRLLMPGTAFLLLMQDKNSAPVNFEIREEIIPGGQPIPTKIYSPNSGSDRAVLLIHGVHWGGYDEERLVRFAKILTQFGLVVATPDIESLKNYNIHSTATDEIEDCAKWLAQRYPQNKIGMMGISFAGGLSICAAGRPSLRDKISAVFSFGGHGDLDRAIQYLVQQSKSSARVS